MEKYIIAVIFTMFISLIYTLGSEDINDVENKFSGDAFIGCLLLSILVFPPYFLMISHYLKNN